MLSRAHLLCVLVTVLVTGCGSPPDPNERVLRDAVSYMKATIRSSQIHDAVRQQDPDLKATSAVTYIMSEAGRKNWPEPGSTPSGSNRKIPPRPAEVTFAADTPNRAVCVTLKGDDGKKHVALNAYSQDQAKPLFTVEIPFGQ